MTSSSFIEPPQPFPEPETTTSDAITSFPSGPGPMNPGAASFHDPIQPSGHPYHDTSIPMPDNNALAARNPSVGVQLQTLRNGGSFTDLTRQINMLGMVYNQRTQDPMLCRLQHQQQQMSMQTSNQLQSSMPPQGQPSLANMNTVPGSMGQMGLNPLIGQPQPQPPFFVGPGVDGAPNGMQSSPPQGNMRSNPAAVGLRPQGMIPSSKFNFEELKNRAIMVQKALKDMEARKAALTSQLAISPNTGLEVEIARTDKAILEHQQLFQRIVQIVRAATQGMTPQSGGPSGEMSNMNLVGSSGFPNVNTQNENIHRNVSSLTGTSEPQPVQQLIKWSVQSNEQLRQLGVDPRLIEKVDLHRTALQRTYYAQETFLNQMHQTQAQIAAADEAQQLRMLAQAQQQQGLDAPSPAGGGASRLTNAQPQPQQQPPLGLAGPDGRQFVRRRLSPEDLTKMLAFITKVKGEYIERTKGLREVTVPEHERLDYNMAFEQLYRLVAETEPKMHFYASHLREEGTRKLLAIITITQHQRALLSSSTPKYVLDMKTVRSMICYVRDAQQGAQAYLDLAAGPQNQQLLQPPPQPQLPGSTHQQPSSQATVVSPPQVPQQAPQPPPPRGLPPPQTTPPSPPAVVATAPYPAHQVQQEMPVSLFASLSLDDVL